MYSIFNLAVLTILGLHSILALSLNIPARPLNRTREDPLLSGILRHPSLLHNEDDITCFDSPFWKRPNKVSLTICQPTFDDLEARPDFKFQHTYGADKQERVPIAPGPCVINLFPKNIGGITVITYQTIVYFVKQVLEKCKDLEQGGTHFIGIDWFLEVLGSRTPPMSSGNRTSF